MRLLLHVGMGKTGTSTLQHALTANHDLLARAGILYPANRFSQSNNHNGLMSPFLDLAERVPREFNQDGANNGASMSARGHDLWLDIKRQIEAARPEIVVLSGEYFFYQPTALLEALRELLTEVFTDIQVVAYVRDPAAYYLSLIQQTVRASYSIPAPSEFDLPLRPSLGRQLEVFDGRVGVRVFDRLTLADGCIVRDFLRTFVPDGDALANEVVVSDLNESMSAEAMCILQRLRLHVWPDRNDVFTPQSARIMEILADKHRRLTQTPAQLKPGISAAIIRKYRTHLEWLEHEFGLAFVGPTTNAVDESEPPDGWTSHELIDILAVDRLQVEAVLFDVLNVLLSASVRTRARRARAAAAAPRARLRDLRLWSPKRWARAGTKWAEQRHDRANKAR